MARDAGGGLEDLIDEETKRDPLKAMPAANVKVQQTIAALGISQRAASPWKALPPEALAGQADVMEALRRRRSPLMKFLDRNKLLLTIAVICGVLMVIARPSGINDVGYQMIARPLVERLSAVRGIGPSCFHGV